MHLSYNLQKNSNNHQLLQGLAVALQKDAKRMHF